MICVLIHWQDGLLSRTTTLSTLGHSVNYLKLLLCGLTSNIFSLNNVGQCEPIEIFEADKSVRDSFGKSIFTIHIIPYILAQSPTSLE